jgi:hypothetical protein
MSAIKREPIYMNLIKEHVSRSLCDSVLFHLTAHGPMNQKISGLSVAVPDVFSMQLSDEAYMTAHGPTNLRDEPIKL